MSGLPLVSILIPCGPNHVHLLDRAVESANAQTVPVEVLTYVDQERKGPAFGRNLLAARARGLFVSMLDADDYLYPNAYERMLEAWEPGSYVYSDWHEFQDGALRHIESTSCYIDWRHNKPEQRAYHLTPVLFPTQLYHALGGMDERIDFAEDTHFFWKANINGVVSIRVREPLFVYSDDGNHTRSTEGKEHPNWSGILGKLLSEFQRKAIVACCGDLPEKRSVLEAKHQENDVLVRTRYRGNQKVVGRVSGRNYGRHGNGDQFWMDPADAAAKPRDFETSLDVAELSPSKAKVNARRNGNQQPAPQKPKLTGWAQKIAEAGVRNWATMEKPGLDIQQDPEEIAALIDFALVSGVQTVLEIGTGESGGLARFFAGTLGWHVLSIDPNVPETYQPNDQGVMPFESGGTWRVFQADSQDAELTLAGINAEQSMSEEPAEAEVEFDLVFIDGDHTMPAVKNDHENYGKLGRIVAFHDISDTGWWGETAAYWKEISRTAKGALRAKHFEAINPPAKVGIGWYVNR